MLVKSYQFTGIDFGHLGQLHRNNQKQSGIFVGLIVAACVIFIDVVVQESGANEKWGSGGKDNIFEESR